MVVAAVHFMYIFMETDVVVNVTNQVSQLLPDDGVHAPDLGCTLQNTEGLGERLGLVCRSQGCPVTTATNSGAGVVQGERSRKREDGQRHECNPRKYERNSHFSVRMCTACAGLHTCTVRTFRKQTHTHRHV